MNPLLIPAGAVFWLSMAIRVPSEEQLMQKRFRKQWDAYVASTGCFVPRFRR
jgi:protein-S-isoprenylcysteine O-methyltransferase Ste14